MVDIAVILGATRDRAMTELKESLLFELKLANVRSIDEILNYYNQIVWPNLLRACKNPSISSAQMHAQSATNVQSTFSRTVIF